MKKKIALVLSGGGARGLAHIGVIEELEHRGFEISSIAGTSMGAIVAGVYTLGKLAEFKTWTYSLDMSKVFSLIDFTFSTEGLIKGDKVFKKMKEFIADEKIEHLSIPFAAVATDLLSRKEVVFREGSMYDALRASVAIPTVVTPVHKKNMLLVDGGVLNNIPIHIVERTDDDLLVAVNVNASVPVFKARISNEKGSERHTNYLQKLKTFYNHIFDNHGLDKEEHLGYFDMMDKTMGLMADRIAEMELEKFSPDVLVRISRNSCSTFDFYKAEELVEIGRHATSEIFDKYLKENV